MISTSPRPSIFECSPQPQTQLQPEDHAIADLTDSELPEFRASEQSSESEAENFQIAAPVDVAIQVPLNEHIDNDRQAPGNTALPHGNSLTQALSNIPNDTWQAVRDYFDHTPQPTVMCHFIGTPLCVGFLMTIAGAITSANEQMSNNTDHGSREMVLTGASVCAAGAVLASLVGAVMLQALRRSSGNH
ncbi:hypothetical protein [Variovorax sp. KK3]|uniref:hypothetical protein n=1 Tax=Variovorax sp. KK3 TaxID=1855728 RepID=UPI00118013DE|nr:hypothetical protein [Variovorax sp. KK3]